MGTLKIFGREPAFWVGLIASLILGAIQTIAGEGLISDATQGRITDLVNAAAQLLVLLAPLLAALVIRQGVTPVAAPNIPGVIKTPIVDDPQPELGAE